LQIKEIFAMTEMKISTKIDVVNVEQICSRMYRELEGAMPYPLTGTKEISIPEMAPSLL
jgi:hypothetical protein